MNTGVVVWFDKQIGYGFIRKADGKDIFIHSGLTPESLVSEFKSGDKVGFIPKAGFEKYMATKVWKIHP